MRVTIQSDTLKEVLARGSMSASADPIKTSTYKGFGRMEYRDGKLFVQSEGATVASMAFVHIEEDGEEGACVCNIEQVIKMIKYIPKGDSVTLTHVTTEEDTAGKLVIKSKKKKTEMGCAHHRLYSMLRGPQGDKIANFVGEDLFAALDNISFAGDVNDADNLRSNICLRSEDGIMYAAAARRELLCYTIIGDGNMSGDIFLPLSIVKDLKKFFVGGDVGFVQEGDNLYMVQERGWVRFCSPSVKGFPKFTAFSEVETSGVSRLAMDSFIDVLGSCCTANQIEAGMVISQRKVTMAAMGSENGIKHVGSVSCSEDSDEVEERFTFSPFMVMDFFKGKKSMDPTFSLEISSGTGSVNYMKISNGNLRFYMKERKMMTTNPLAEISSDV